MSMIRLLPAILLSLALITQPGVSQEEKKPAPNEKEKAKEKPQTAQSKLMAEKLKQAQLLLDGLATNDFKKIGKSADELMLISKTAEFLAYNTREYQIHTNAFRRSLETISKKAEEKNLDGATLAYMDMTLNCVRCHQHTREVRNAIFVPTPRLPVE
jgi:hypothetical protein